MTILLRSYAVLIYRTIVITLRHLQRCCSPSFACKLQNLFVAAHRAKIRYRYNQKNGLYIATENDLVRYFGDMGRGFDFYARSIEKRGKNLADSYCMQHISFNCNDVVIDCGANYGDLYLYLKDKIKESNYIAIEPGPMEYKCLLNSVPEAQVLNLGLSNSNGELDFYLCSKSGDSSFVKPRNYTDVVKVKIKTLDCLVKELKVSSCKILML